MKSNLRLFFGVALLFGISTGLYEYILPLYLVARGVNFERIGLIFALAGLAMVLARIYMGGLADRWGRKPLYAWALAICGGATLVTPFTPGLLGQAVVKTLRDIAALTRETIYPVILFEEGQAGFLNRIGKFRGIEFLLQAGGTLLAGVVIAYYGAGPIIYQWLFFTAGAVLLLGYGCWILLFREVRQPQVQRTVKLRELFNLDLHDNLRVLLLVGVIFTFGMQVSHSFFMPIFYQTNFPQYHNAAAVTPWIMVAHRVTIALPMLLVGNLRLRNLRAWYIWGLIIEGATVAGAAIIPSFAWSAGVFLLHDLIGAGIWSPIQATLIQRYSRDETRGMEVGKVMAWSSIGSIFGPLAAGVLARWSLVLPFFVSGVVMLLAAIPLLWLNTHAPRPAPAPVAAEPVA